MLSKVSVSCAKWFPLDTFSSIVSNNSPKGTVSPAPVFAKEQKFLNTGDQDAFVFLLQVIDRKRASLPLLLAITPLKHYNPRCSYGLGMGNKAILERERYLEGVDKALPAAPPQPTNPKHTRRREKWRKLPALPFSFLPLPKVLLP